MCTAVISLCGIVCAFFLALLGLDSALKAVVKRIGFWRRFEEVVRKGLVHYRIDHKEYFTCHQCKHTFIGLGESASDQYEEYMLVSEFSEMYKFAKYLYAAYRSCDSSLPKWEDITESRVKYMWVLTARAAILEYRSNIELQTYIPNENKLPKSPVSYTGVSIKNE